MPRFVLEFLNWCYKIKLVPNYNTLWCFSTTDGEIVYPATNKLTCHLTYFMTPASKSAHAIIALKNTRQLLNINPASPCRVFKAWGPTSVVAVTQFAATGQIPALGHQTKWRLVLVMLGSAPHIFPISDALLEHWNVFYLWLWLQLNLSSLRDSSQQKEWSPFSRCVVSEFCESKSITVVLFC
jgi:hypothetical protein